MITLTLLVVGLIMVLAIGFVLGSGVLLAIIDPIVAIVMILGIIWIIKKTINLLRK